MKLTYRLTAVPTLFTEGQYKGKLKGVTFTATSHDDTRRWFTKNFGQFEAEFSKLLCSRMAKVLADALTRGSAVEFPDVFQEHQFASGFMFEWSPVGLVSPPDLAYKS